MFLDKQQGLCHKIDIAAPGDAPGVAPGDAPGGALIEEKEKEKMEKYHDLRREVARRVNVSVTHVVVGSLGMVTENLQRSLQQIGVTVRTEFLQKAAYLGTARILRKVLQA